METKNVYFLSKPLLKKTRLYFISNNLQEPIVKAEVLENFHSDHSSMDKICISKELRRG